MYVTVEGNGARCRLTSLFCFCFCPGMAVVDLSVAGGAYMHDVPDMLAYHVLWKANPPYHRVFLGLLLLSLPFAFYTMISEDVVGMLYRPPQTRRRHIIGVMTLCTCSLRAPLNCT